MIERYPRFIYTKKQEDLSSELFAFLIDHAIINFLIFLVDVTF